MNAYETAVRAGEDAYASVDELCAVACGSPADAAAAASGGLANLLQVRRRLLAVHAKRHLVTELVATGKLSQSEAQAMVDAGASVAYRPGASGAAFANILAWLQANGPSIAQDIAAAIPIIISLLTLFGA
jgi:hypothetical protein